MILTEVGEVGVTFQKKGRPPRVFKLRPSLYAMSKIGTPREIVAVYADIMTDFKTPAHQLMQLESALLVLFSCADESDDLTPVFGYFNEQRAYVRGAADPDDVVLLARSLMRHGLVGALPPLKDEASYTVSTEFVVRDVVASIMAHLGLSEREAWNMTMTGAVLALRAKFPEIESPDGPPRPAGVAPTAKQHDATMAWFDKIEATRRRQKGVH